MEPSGTIKILGYSCFLYPNCNDETIVKKLQTSKNGETPLLDPTVPSSSLKLECNSTPYNDEVEEELGQGSFNIVYSLQKNKDKVFRITQPHVIHRQDLTDGEMTGLFIQSLLSKDCQNLCRVFEFGIYSTPTPYNTTVEGVYAIMESLPFSLKDILENKLVTNEFHMMNIFYDVFKGLECMHILGYVHLDIKPANIGLTKDYTAKIYDFGFARYLPNDPKIERVDQKLYANTVGSPKYIDPYYRERGIVTLKSDVYAVGIMLYKYYVQPIKTYNDIIDVIGKTQKKQIDKNLEALIIGCLQPDPKNRYSATEALSNPWFVDKEKTVIGKPVGGRKNKKRSTRKTSVKKIRKTR